MTNHDGTWKCPKCEITAVVKGRDISVYLTGHTFPLHGDCELGKEIDLIDFSKLEKVD